MNGGDPNSLVLITGLSVDVNTGYSVVFKCTAPPTVQQFTIPSYVLAWMPTTTSSIGFLALQNLCQTRFQAPGLEVGYLTYQVGNAVQVSQLYFGGPRQAVEREKNWCTVPLADAYGSSITSEPRP